MNDRQRTPQQNGNQYQYRHGRYHGNTPGYNNKQSRRDYLWQKRLELELELHYVIAQEQKIQMDLQTSQRRKALLQQQRPRVVAQILLSGFARHPAPTPGERVYHYEMERLTQDEDEILHRISQWQADFSRLNGQIATVKAEIALL